MYSYKKKTAHGGAKKPKNYYLKKEVDFLKRLLQGSKKQ